MVNPWRELPTKRPFVLPCDRVSVDLFNRSTKRDALRIETSLLPEPFTGRPDAPVVVLALNPGLSEEDARNHRKAAFRQRLLDCLRHEATNYPFHHLDPIEDGPGARWWLRTMGAVMAVTGRETLARKLFCIEFFPYHSSSFGHAHLRLPSQAYSFELVRRAMRRDAVILLTRGRGIWFGAVPELATYRHLHSVGNWRSASISPRNCPEGFEATLRKLKPKGARRVARS